MPSPSRLHILDFLLQVLVHIPSGVVDYVFGYLGYELDWYIFVPPAVTTVTC